MQREAGCRSSDPFPGKRCERFKSSKEIWIHHYESAVWRTAGRKKDLPALYKEFGESFKNLDSWSAYMITSYEDAERYFGRKADNNRKIYNGMLKTYFYQFSRTKAAKGRTSVGETGDRNKMDKNYICNRK